MSNMTLSQVLELLENINGQEGLVEHQDEIFEYSAQVDKVATDVFSRQTMNYAKGLLALVQSLAISIMVSRGEISTLKLIQMMNDDTLDTYTVLVIKMVVGISAMEELR